MNNNRKNRLYKENKGYGSENSLYKEKKEKIIKKWNLFGNSHIIIFIKK